ncbi:MAG: SPOR domain-containing protein, partial [Desulfurivibrionaceae bacterium]
PAPRRTCRRVRRWPCRCHRQRRYPHPTYREAGSTVKKFKDHPDFRKGEFYVQIGSFVDKGNAGRLRDKMVARGRKTVIQEFDRGDLLFFRVQVKAGATLSEAEQIEKELTRGEFPAAYVVAR